MTPGEYATHLVDYLGFDDDVSVLTTTSTSHLGTGVDLV